MAQAGEVVGATAMEEETKVAVDPKLEKLRSLMATANNGKPIDALIVPSEDPHMVCLFSIFVLAVSALQKKVLSQDFLK